MRVLFTFAGGLGHFQPLIPLASAVAAAGHTVAFAASPARSAAIESAGFTAFGVGEGRAGEIPERQPLLVPDRDREDRDLRDGFVRRGAGRRLPLYLDLFGRWRPDVVVCEELDFGSVLQGSSPQQALLAFFNDNPLAAQAFTDFLSSTGSVASGSGFTITGDSVSNLAGGVIGAPPFDVTFDTSVLGNFTEVLTFDVESINPNFDGFLGPVTLRLEGDVVSSSPSVAEPGTMTVLASGLGMVFFAVRRRRRMQ